MGALRGRANNPSTPKSFTLSHYTLISISSARLICYQKVQKKAWLKCQHRIGVGIRCPLLLVIIFWLFWVKSVKTTEKETRFLVSTWAKKQKRNWNVTTRTTLAAVNWSDGLMISGQSKTLSIIKGFLVHILRKIKKRHRYWLSPVLISATRCRRWSSRWHAPPRLSLQPRVSRCARGTPHRTAGRTGLAIVKIDQSEASPKNFAGWLLIEQF